LVEPFAHAPALQFSPVIVLDGLDESQDHKTQQWMLRLFIGAIRTGQLPVRILISSRCEPHLLDVLDLEKGETSKICCHSQLNDDKSAYNDIRTYLRDKFSGIHSECEARGLDLGDPWPFPGLIDDLVNDSSG
ncbi:hypothetical protein C8F04DRAFT_915322, partial [Mycena alexandri]